MATLKKYDLQGKEVGVVDLDDALLKGGAHPQSVKDYIVAIRKNARQWSANTKVRREVNCTGRKPHPQKVQGGHVAILEGELKAPKTKRMVEFFENMGSIEKRVLVLSERGERSDSLDNLVKSIRNLPKKEHSPVALINGYELARASELVVLGSALDEFLSILGAS